jgi:hypothetical protein
LLAPGVNDESTVVANQRMPPYWLVADVAVDGLAKRVGSELMLRRGFVVWMRYCHGRPDERRVLGVVKGTSVVNARVHRDG